MKKMGIDTSVTDPPALEPVVSWSSSERFWFRVYLIFFVIYILPFPINSLTFLSGDWYDNLLEGYSGFWHSIVAGLNDILHIFPYPITVFANGSGDTSADYLQYGLFAVIAFVGAIIWSIFDRKPRSYRRTHMWLRILVRYYLFTVLVNYGIVKIFHLQMPYPGLSALATPLGDHSPMGLAWTYLGYSKGFSMFAGGLEVIAGILVLFRRTVTIGSLLGVIIFFHIFLINLFFDVPVKLFSFVLLLMSLFLLLPERHRLSNVFWYNRVTGSIRQPRPSFPRSWMCKSAVLAKWIFFISTLWSFVINANKNTYQYGDNMPLPRFYGIYNIRSIAHNDEVVPLLLGDSIHYKQIIFEKWQFGQFRYLNDSTAIYNVREDSLHHILTTYDWQDSLGTAKSYDYKLEPGHLELRSVSPADTLVMSFDKYDENKFLLMQIPFRWINEHPFNR